MGRKTGETPKGSELRQRAEERVKKRGARTEPLKDADRERLIHELQVHQVELEMQNEELRRLKDESEALAEKYLDIYDFAPIGYLTIDPDGKILQANLTGAGLIGMPRSGLIGRRLANLIAPESLPRFDAFFKQSFRTEKTETCEVGLVGKGGPPLTVQLEAKAFPDRAECRVAMIDVTKRRKAEEGLRRYELLALHGRDIILFSDCDDGRIIEANAAAARAYGYTREELQILTIRDLSAVDAAEPAAVKPGGDENRCLLFESLHRRRDGTVFPVEVSLRGTNVEGRCMLISIIRDITVRKQAEAALEEQTKQLEIANKELESFSYSVSHDLQTPLRAIDGYARMILKQQGEQFNSESRAKFEVIRTNIHKMGQLINDLLAFSRLGRRHLAISAVDVEALVKEIWEELKTINPDRSLTLKIHSVPTGMGDRALLKEVLINILSNAIKFTRTRSEAVVEVGGSARRGETIYYVKDNGVGFNMDYAGKLFGVFQRLHGPDEYEGTGVGLAIARRVIERHGGRIWAEGEEGKGATFYFALPKQK